MKSKIFILLFSITSLVFGQIKNAKTVEVEISGNCGMCKSTIEKAANQAQIAQLVWNKDTKKAVLTYDSAQTNPKEVLKRVAQAGYDNQYFYGNDKAYENLPACCHYERKSKESTTAKACCGADKSACKSDKKMICRDSCESGKSGKACSSSVKKS